MKRVSIVVAVVAGLFFVLFFASASWAQTPTSPTGIDKMYVLQCGVGAGTDIGPPFTNDIDEGVAHTDPVHCYLIHHATKGYFLVDTGISDYVADLKDGWYAGGLQGVHWTRPKGSLLSQLAAIGVKPSDIHGLSVSHNHPDHIGNVEEFPDATVYIQHEEYEFVFREGAPALAAPPNQPLTSFRRDHPVRLLDGDCDVFGDKSLLILYTPGHTPGHQSVMAHLPQTGWIIFSGDAVHKETNWINDRIPRRMEPIAKMETITSMHRIRNLMDTYKAQLWINHDDYMEKTLKYSPLFYQ